MAPAELQLPEAWTTKGMIFMATTSLAQQLCELEERYRHELMSEEERLRLLEAIKCLQRRLASLASGVIQRG